MLPQVSKQVIGISLVRNEDLYLRQVITNVAEVCDKIIILDNNSSDDTPKVIADLQKDFSHIDAYSINDPNQSHAFISHYAGTESWIFGIDGDEIYDPVGLKQFMTRLRAGEFDNSWMILGNVVNCVELNSGKLTARGYVSPPCRSMTKLYNFSLLRSWQARAERLHADGKQFRPGFNESCRLVLNKSVDWEQAEFRCLHLCFIRRSSRDESEVGARVSPGETPGWFNLLRRVGLGEIFSRAVKGKTSPWKNDNYRRGDIVVVNTEPFFLGPDREYII